MNRRQFLSLTSAALLKPSLNPPWLPAAASAPLQIAFRRTRQSPLFEQVTVNDQPLVIPDENVGLLDAFCQPIENQTPAVASILNANTPSQNAGAIRLSLTHQLHSSSHNSTEDLLRATLTLRNTSDKASQVLAGFLTGARPCPDPARQQVYLPLSASPLGDSDNDPRKRLKDCRQNLRNEPLLCHYLEPAASNPAHSSTRAPLLLPILDISADNAPCRIALFTLPTQPAFFQSNQGPASRAWRAATTIRLAPGQSLALTAFLLIHSADPSHAWNVFRQFAHKEEFPPIAWPGDVRVHYFDFLGPAKANGPRGPGYDADSQHFNEFHVGMATQHGYYLSYGDFIHPDRKQWTAMPNDPAGPVPMSLDIIRQRIQNTRKLGVRPAIYMHYTILDEGSPLFENMRDSIQVNPDGNPVPFGWEGPDVIRKTWKMSHASPQWRKHLVQQAHWIMELLNPDAIVLDETFSAYGIDHHKSHGGPLSLGGIELMRQLRNAVRQFGPDKALFASDCSMGNFCLWGDGEAGDHCYDRLLGHDLYRTSPIRYTAPLGKKPWLPCAWLYKSLWNAQVDLARKTRAAVGLTNGWGDNLGLTRLPHNVKQQMLADINTLVRI